MTVYCARPVEALTVADLRGALDSVEDWYTLAEGYDLDEAAVDEARRHLRLEGEHGHFELRCREDPTKLRPLEIHCWTKPERVAEEKQEASERLSGLKPKSAEAVLKHLVRCVAVMGLEMSWPMLERMEVVYAEQLAFYLAKRFDGQVRGVDDRWYEALKYYFRAL
jgi:hypothetical protein